MKKIISMVTIAAFIFTVNVNAQQKENKKEATKSGKSCSIEEKKSCDKDKKGSCCAKKTEKKVD